MSYIPQGAWGAPKYNLNITTPDGQKTSVKVPTGTSLATLTAAAPPAIKAVLTSGSRAALVPMAPRSSFPMIYVYGGLAVAGLAAVYLITKRKKS